MTILANILAVAAAAWFLYWEFIDQKVSKLYPLYVEYEANKWARNKDGYFDPKKSLLLTSIYFAAGVVLWIFLSPWAPAILYAIAGTWIFIVVSKNQKVQKEKLDAQVITLRRIKQDPDGYSLRVQDIKEEKDFHGKPIYFVKPNFWDVRVEHEGLYDDLVKRQEYADILAAKMRRLAAKDESSWKKLDRMKGI